MRSVFQSHGGGSTGITVDQIETIVDKYRNTSVKQKVDHDVEKFTKNKAVWSAGRDMVLEEITRLIHVHTYAVATN